MPLLFFLSMGVSEVLLALIISVHLTASCSSMNLSLYWFLSISTRAISTLIQMLIRKTNIDTFFPQIKSIQLYDMISFSIYDFSPLKFTPLILYLPLPSIYSFSSSIYPQSLPFFPFLPQFIRFLPPSTTFYPQFSLSINIFPFSFTPSLSPTTSTLCSIYPFLLLHLPGESLPLCHWNLLFFFLLLLLFLHLLKNK